MLPGTQIGQEPVALGEVREMLTVRPPEPSNGAEARLAAQQLAASGWTEDVQSALLELVGSGTPPVSAISQVEPQRSSAATEDPNPEKEHFHENCIYVDNPNEGTRAQGCFKRYWGQENEYEAFTGSTSKAFAAVDSSELVLTIVTTAHSYGNARMRDYDPMSPIEQGACGTVGLGLSGYGVSVSQSQQICPEKLFPTILDRGTVYGVDWRGTVTSGEQRHTELVEIARLDKGNPPNPSPAQTLFGFAYHMDFRAENRCSAKPEDCFGGPGKLISDLITELLH